jgi:DHA1 family arabinose polymer transporter-like MFS transporter
MITAIGTGGLFCWISYISPLMTDVAHFSESKVPYVMLVAGLGMVVGNVVGGFFADRVNPVLACLVLLLAMSTALFTIYLTTGSQVMAVLMTFVCGSFSMAIAAPIQILMINTTRGAEMLGASATQAAFNIGNALGAFLGGLPLAAGFSYTSPELVGVSMAMTGAGFAYWLMRRTQRADSGRNAPAFS